MGESSSDPDADSTSFLVGRRQLRPVGKLPLEIANNNSSCMESLTPDTTGGQSALGLAPLVKTR